MSSDAEKRRRNAGRSTGELNRLGEQQTRKGESRRLIDDELTSRRPKNKPEDGLSDHHRSPDES